MGKLIFLWLFWIFIAGTIYGQPLTLNQFLKSSLSDPVFKSFDAQQDYLGKSKNYTLPWISRLQFRFQDNEFNDFQNRSGIRLDPVNPWQRKNNSQYFQGIKALRNLEQKVQLKEILNDRYIKVVEFWMAEESTLLTKKQRKIREQIVYALGKKAGSANFDADDYLEAQLDVIAKEADCHEADFDRDVARGKILAIGGAESFDLSFSDLINVDQISQLAETETAAERTDLEVLKQRMEVSNLKMKLEKTNVDLGFLQTMYSSDRRIGGENSVGLALGINIPIANQNKENIAREKMNNLELYGELEQFQAEEKIKIANAVAHLKLHLINYKKLDSLIVAVKSKGLNVLTGQSNNYDPVIELKYQEKLIQFDLLKTKIKREVLMEYISFLANSNKLQERPLVNYLSMNFENVE